MRNDDEFFSVSGAAWFAKVSEKTIRRMLLDGLRASRAGKWLWRIKKSDLVVFMAERGQKND